MTFTRLKKRSYLQKAPVLLLLMCLGQIVQAQQIKGRVVSDTNEPLPGVSIQIEGTTTGTVTDIDGNYSIAVPSEESVLVFTYIGYLTERRTVGTQSEIQITMVSDLKTLDEIVVIGYGTAKKRDLTGAASSVSNKDIEEKQPVSIYDAIRGAAPGVQVLSSSGAPGGSSQLRIRGTSTFSDGGVVPLYVVDGTIVDNIDAINPGDIQTMEILKDAASASIYGSRSANGVVLITTKRGQEGKSLVDIRYLQSYSRLSHTIPQSNRLEREIFDRRTNVGLAPFPADSTSFSRNSDNDYQSLMTQTARRNQVDLSISGGSKQIKYFSSMQYLNDQGIVISSSYKRLTARGNVDFSFNDKLTMGTRNSFIYTKQSLISEGNVINTAMKRPPQMSLYYPSGGYLYNNGGQRNPVAEAELRPNFAEIYKGLTAEYFDYKFAPWLTLHGDLAADLSLTRTKKFNSKLLDTNTPQISTGSDATDLKIHLQGNSYLSFNKEFNNAHTVSAMIGSSFETNSKEETNIEGNTYITEAVTTMNAAGVITTATSGGTKSSLAGFFGRLGYNYKSRYLVNATYRYDGSSRFGKAKRWGAYPSASVAWRFSDEQFMHWSKSILDDGKVRFSWGITGNQSIGDYDSQTQFVFGTYKYNGVSGVTSGSTMGNDQLKWEETKQQNAGIDLTFFNSRITFVGDYYVKDTKGLLYLAPLPLEVGYTGVRMNYGSVQNKGVELSLTVVPVRNSKFSWTSTINWSTNKNKITDLPGGDYATDIFWVGKGYATGTFYGYKYLGIYAYDQSNAWTPDYKTMLTPVFQQDAYGNIIIGKDKNPILLYYTYPDGSKYVDRNGNAITANGAEGACVDADGNPVAVAQMRANGSVSKGGDIIWSNLPDSVGKRNGSIGNEDRQTLGNAQPKWYAGWTNNLTYKNFSLSFSFYFSRGNSIYNAQSQNNATYASSNVTPTPYVIYNSWKYPGQITDVYAAQKGSTDNPRTANSYWLEDGAFIRLQNIRLGYELDKKIAQKIFVKGLMLYVYGNNLVTWTNYSGFDPEVNQNSVLTPGKDTGKYPRRKEYGLGINLTF